MKASVTAALVGLVLGTLCPAAFAQKAVFLVRHADRLDSSDDSPLSKAGEARAQRLAMLLKQAGITTIYTSEWQRTVMTAEPLATALKIKPVTVPSTDPERLLKRIRSEHAEDIVLIVGHQKTVPVLLKLFGHSSEIFIERNDYDDLFVCIPRGDHPPALLYLSY